jgi:hypothetical protein
MKAPASVPVQIGERRLPHQGTVPADFMNFEAHPLAIRHCQGLE